MYDSMYGVGPDGKYLEHYGIKGMKWGVRKAREMGGTRGSRRLTKAYNKAARKLAKLEKRANNGKKYAKRAAALGAGAAAAGGLAALGTGGASKLMKGVGRGISSAQRGVGGAMNSVGKAAITAGVRSKVLPSGVKKALRAGGAGLRDAGAVVRDSRVGGGVQSGLTRAGTAVGRWGRGNSIGTALGGAAANAGNGVSRGLVRAGTKLGASNAGAAAGHAVYKGSRSASKALGGVSNNTYARIGAGAIGAGLAAGAGYNAYRAATTKRAAKKAAQWKSEMNKAFAGTQYAGQTAVQRKKKHR